MDATQNSTVPACTAVRLIGALDADLVAAFVRVERQLGRLARGIVLVDLRDVTVEAEREVRGFVDLIRRARAEGRDVRLEGYGVAWRAAVKQHFSRVPPVDAQLRSAIRRTIILAHSHNAERSTIG